MSDKQQILDAIRAIARGLGRAPSQSEFVALSEISEYSVSQCFSSWNDAVRPAGLHPNTLNVRLEDSEPERLGRNRPLKSRYTGTARLPPRGEI